MNDPIYERNTSDVIYPSPTLHPFLTLSQQQKHFAVTP